MSSWNCGGVVLLYRDSPAFAVEEICHFGANVIVCQLVTGERRWYIVKCYLAPGDGAPICGVEAALVERPKGTELVVVGDLNVNIERTGELGRDEKITAAVATVRLEDLLVHLLLRQIACTRYWRTWAVVIQER